MSRLVAVAAPAGSLVVYLGAQLTVVLMLARRELDDPVECNVEKVSVASQSDQRLHPSGVM